MKTQFSRPPNGVELRPLTELHDMEKVVSVWPSRTQNSLAFVQKMAKHNINLGAFTSDGTLVAWVFR